MPSLFFSLPLLPHADPPNFGFFFLSPESACTGGSSPRQSLHGGAEACHQLLTAELGCGAGSVSCSGLCWSQPRSALPGQRQPCRNKVRRGLKGSLGSRPSATRWGWDRRDVVNRGGFIPGGAEGSWTVGEAPKVPGLVGAWLQTQPTSSEVGS